LNRELEIKEGSVVCFGKDAQCPDSDQADGFSHGTGFAVISKQGISVHFEGKGNRGCFAWIEGRKRDASPSLTWTQTGGDVAHAWTGSGESS
jgi:hypothetical protein